MTENEWLKIITRKRINTEIETLKLMLKYRKPYQNPMVKTLKSGGTICPKKQKKT